MNKMFYGSAPLFLVSDLAKSLDYYCDILGFERPFLWGEPPSFAMPKRENMIVMLQVAGEKGTRTNLGFWDAYYWVKDVKTLFEEYQSKGAAIKYGPEKRSYGNLEFAVTDPDGYQLAFAQEIEGDPFFESNPLEGKKPETKFLYLSPVLASADVPRDIEWYEQKLGFKNVFDSTAYQEGPPDYAVVGRQNLFLHLQFQFPKDMTSTDVRFEVKNIEPLFEEYVANKTITPDRMRRKTSWGTNEFGLFDLNKNRITFFEDL